MQNDNLSNENIVNICDFVMKKSMSDKSRWSNKYQNTRTYNGKISTYWNRLSIFRSNFGVTIKQML